MKQIKQSDFDKISKDYRGQLDGKRTVFAGCIIDNGGTRLAIEGVDFEITPAPVKRGRYA
jgi:hypothetical protein